MKNHAQNRHRQGRVRLDRLIVERGLAESRERAQALVLAGQVLVDGQKKDKAGALVPVAAAVRILGEKMRYVSRGGVKLEAAVREFAIDVNGRVCVDIGASTGGFTDCLLQHGAEKIYAVDVGYGQMAWKLRQNPRVVVLERQNIREIDRALIPECVNFAVIDVSFISLEKVIPAVTPLLAGEALLVALIKPQFEVGRGNVGKGGIVRDRTARNEARDRIASFVAEQGFVLKGVIPSPITGHDGNQEFLLCAAWKSGP